MTALLRIIVGVLALSLLSVFAHAEKNSNVLCLVAHESRMTVEETASSLRRDLMNAYEEFKARQRGIFNENISAVVEAHLVVGQTFEDANAILQAAGFEHLKKFRYQPSNAEELYVSNLVLLKGLAENITVNVRISFRHTGTWLAVSNLDAAMIANYL